MEIIIYFIITIIIITLTVSIIAYLKKLSIALFTQNYKQNKTDCKKILQPFADAVKLFCKEDCAPNERKKFLFFAAPLIALCAAISAFCLIPINDCCILSNTNSSTILLAALFSIPFTARFLAGFSSNCKFSIISAIQSIIQSISYAIPMAISILAVSFLAGTLNLKELIQAQNGATWLFSWHFIPQILGCTVFFISALIFLNCTPFDISKVENRPIPGYAAEYSGLKLGFFIISEYILLFLVSLFFVCLYFGGYLSPFGVYVLPDFLIPLEQVFWLIFKTFFIVFFIILIKITLPKITTEKLLDFSYKILIPLSLINLNITILIQYFTGIN